MLAWVIPNVSASCATRVPDRAGSTTCLRTSTEYLLGIASSSLNAGGFQKRDSAKPRSDQSPHPVPPGLGMETLSRIAWSSSARELALPPQNPNHARSKARPREHQCDAHPAQPP